MAVLQFPRVLIQPMQREHLDAAATLIHDNWHAFYTTHLPPGQFSAKALSEFCSYLDRRQNQSWVALLDHAMVGIVCLSANFIDELWVRPSHRRYGIGSGLLERAIAHLQRRNFDTVYAGAEDFNYEASAFFRAHGWFKSATRRMRLPQDYEYESQIYSISLR